MKTYKTFTDGHFNGYLTMKEIHELRNEARALAFEKQQKMKADHMVYGHYALSENGEIENVWLYSGLPYSDEQFERIARTPGIQVFAFHKRDRREPA